MAWKWTAYLWSTFNRTHTFPFIHIQRPDINIKVFQFFLIDGDRMLWNVKKHQSSLVGITAFMQGKKATNLTSLTSMRKSTTGLVHQGFGSSSPAHQANVLISVPQDDKQFLPKKKDCIQCRRHVNREDWCVCCLEVKWSTKLLPI